MLAAVISLTSAVPRGLVAGGAGGAVGVALALLAFREIKIPVRTGATSGAPKVVQARALPVLLDTQRVLGAVLETVALLAIRVPVMPITASVAKRSLVLLPALALSRTF